MEIDPGKGDVKQPGKFKVTASCATVHAGVSVVVEAAGQKLTGKVPAAGAWKKFEESALGTIEIKQAGQQTVSIRPGDAQTWKAANLRSVVFTPEN